MLATPTAADTFPNEREGSLFLLTANKTISIGLGSNGFAKLQCLGDLAMPPAPVNGLVVPGEQSHLNLGGGVPIAPCKKTTVVINHRHHVTLGRDPPYGTDSTGEYPGMLLLDGLFAARLDLDDCCHGRGFYTVLPKALDSSRTLFALYHGI